MNHRDESRISQLRDIIRVAKEEINDIENRNYSSVRFQQHITNNWFTKGRTPQQCDMPQGHPSHCGCY